MKPKKCHLCKQNVLTYKRNFVFLFHIVYYFINIPVSNFWKSAIIWVVLNFPNYLKKKRTIHGYLLHLQPSQRHDFSSEEEHLLSENN